jgi:hypothetical protein
MRAMRTCFRLLAVLLKRRAFILDGKGLHSPARDRYSKCHILQSEMLSAQGLDCFCIR